jgi:NADH dehydrogenase
MVQRVNSSQDLIVVTGANGQLGRALLRSLAATGSASTRALVRSERARGTIDALALDPAPEIRIVDYASPVDMEAAVAGADGVVHLVGIIKEMPGTSYAQAHEDTCRTLAHAAAARGVERIVYLSILGADPTSANACLASKGRAERLLLEGPTPTTILRVPMVIGGEDPASASLRRQARARRTTLIGGGSTLQQPIDERDVIRAILAASRREGASDLTIDAGGPESLTHRELVLRAARLWQNEPEIRSLPVGLARAGVTLLDAMLSNPPVSRAMFDILQQDDEVDPHALEALLGVAVTPLDEMLAEHIGPGSPAAHD